MSAMEEVRFTRGRANAADLVQCDDNTRWIAGLRQVVKSEVSQQRVHTAIIAKSGPGAHASEDYGYGPGGLRGSRKGVVYLFSS